MKTVIVVYSRTGRSLRIAEMLAARLGLELCRIDCPRYAGVAGLWRGWRDARRGHLPEITITPAIGAADLLILGGPVWAGRFAPPLRRLMSEARRLPPVAGVFVTRRRIGSSLPLEPDLEALAEVGIEPGADPPLLSLPSRAAVAREVPQALARFAARLEPLVRLPKVPAVLPRRAA
jgi:hypothetical protein